jgi:hypothetical protein
LRRKKLKKIKPLTGWPEKVIPKLEEKIQIYTRNTYYSELGLGITTDLLKTFNQVGFDAIVPIYKTTNLQNVEKVAKVLCEKYANHAKFANYDAADIIEKDSNVFYFYIAVRELLY